MNEAQSIGIIGGADGPTVIMVASPFPWEIILLAAVCIAAVIWFIKRRK